METSALNFFFQSDYHLLQKVSTVVTESEFTVVLHTQLFSMTVQNLKNKINIPTQVFFYLIYKKTEKKCTYYR